MMMTPEVFEPADPARTMPKTLVFGAILAVILLVIGMTWWSNRWLEQPDDSATNAPAAAETPPATQPAAAPAANAHQAVVLTATDAVWLQVYEKGGAILYANTLQPGQTFTVPSGAVAPVLKTGKPEALRVTVGNIVAPAVGPPATTVTDVSLLPADLLKTTPAPAPQTTAPEPASAARAASATRARTTAPAPPPPVEPSTGPTNTGE